MRCVWRARMQAQQKWKCDWFSYNFEVRRLFPFKLLVRSIYFWLFHCRLSANLTNGNHTSAAFNISTACKQPSSNLECDTTNMAQSLYTALVGDDFVVVFLEIAASKNVSFPPTHVDLIFSFFVGFQDSFQHWNPYFLYGLWQSWNNHTRVWYKCWSAKMPCHGHLISQCRWFHDVHQPFFLNCVGCICQYLMGLRGSPLVGDVSVYSSHYCPHPTGADHEWHWRSVYFAKRFGCSQTTAQSLGLFQCHSSNGRIFHCSCSA